MRSICLLLSFLAFISAFDAVSLRPLVIYTSDGQYGTIAAGSFATNFDVRLHPILENCDNLLEYAEKEKSECIVIPKSPECGHNLKNSKAHLVRPSSPDFPGWQSVVNNISQSSNKSKGFVEETTCKEEAGVPLWLTVLIGAVAAILLVGNIIFVAVYCFKKNKSKPEGQNSSNSVKPKTLVPELEKSAKSDELDLSVKSDKSDTTEKSKRSESLENTKRKELSGVKNKKKDFTIMKRQRSPPKAGEGEGDACVMRSDKLNLNALEKPAPLERSMESMRIEPVSQSEFDYYLEKIGRFIVDYNDDPTQYNVTTDEPPGFLLQKISRSAPENPELFNTMFKFFTTYIMKSLTHWQHPNFHAHFPAGRSYPDMLAEFLIASLGVAGSNWESCPAVIEMEIAMVNWVGRALGIPESHLFQDDVANSVGGGWYLETSSEALLSAILAANQSKLRQILSKEVTKEGAPRVIQENFVYYASKEAAMFLEKACRLPLGKCRRIPVNESTEWSLTGEQLEQEIQKDIAAGLIPAFVCVTIGTYATGASDNMKSICEVAKKHNLYVHVDAGLGGMFWIDPKHRSKENCLEMVDSISSNLDCGLLHSANATVFFVNDKNLHSEVWGCSPQISPWNLGEFRLNSNRRFKGLKTWLVMGLYGIQGLQNHINRICDLGDYFKKLVEKHPNCLVTGGCRFGLFSFQYTEPGMTPEQQNEATEALLKFMNNTHKTFFSLANLGCSSVIRVGLWYDRGTKTAVDETWCLVHDLIDEFKQSRNGEAKTDGTEKRKQLPPSSESMQEMMLKSK